MSLALSKTLDPADFEQLTEELKLVDEHFTSAREQHPMRRWEYAMALYAFKTWQLQSPQSKRFVYDIGGAGSPFRSMFRGTSVLVVDPDEPAGPQRPPCDLASMLANYAPRLGPAVFCLSVIEHVDDLDQFLYHLACLVAPGGLLFLTADYWNHCGPDQAHFHWMRKRIFCPKTIVEQVVSRLAGHNFTWLGPHDLRWTAPHVYDYSFVSLAMVKRS